MSATINGRPMRVGQLAEAWLNASENWLGLQIEELQREGVENLVVAMRDAESANRPSDVAFRTVLKPAGNGALRLPIKAANRLIGRFKHQIIKSALAGYRPAVVHSHFGDFAWSVAKTVSALGLPHLVSFYGYDATMLPRQDPIWRDRYRSLFQQVDRVLCEGPYFAGTLMALGCPEEKIELHSLGVDLSELPFRPSLPSADGPLRLLAAGRFVEKKGIEFALTAARRLAAERPVSVTVVGEGDSASQSRIDQLCADLATVAEVRRLGFMPITQLRELARDHHLFFAASVVAASGDQEGGAPVTAIEMQALGLGVVASSHCDLPYVLGQGGVLSPERDVDDLVRQLKDWSDHPELWAEKVHRGRRHVETRFNSRIQGAALAGIYRSVVDNQRKDSGNFHPLHET